jgi:hypothetical protein
MNVGLQKVSKLFVASNLRHFEFNGFLKVQNLLLKSSLPEVVYITGPNFNANRSGLLIGVIIHEGV